MKGAVFLSLVLSCCFCEAADNDNSKGNTCGSVGDSDFSGTFLAYKLGVLEEKIANIEKSSNKEIIQTLQTEIKNLETKVQESKNEILELRSLLAAGPKVAFSAALRDSGSGNVGPFTVETPLKYERVFSNSGDCYDPSTGKFTATVKGMYFFRFSMFNNLSSPPNSVVSLMKNNQRLTSVWDTTGNDANDMGSNAVVISLDKGDTVYVALLAEKLLYDDSMNYNTFAGFLLFTM